MTIPFGQNRCLMMKPLKPKKEINIEENKFNHGNAALIMTTKL
jgi:hypothetical protein